MDEMDESRVGETYERRYAFAGVERRGVGGCGTVGGTGGRRRAKAGTFNETGEASQLLPWRLWLTRMNQQPACGYGRR